MTILEEFEAALIARGTTEARVRDHMRILRQLDDFIGPRHLHHSGGKGVVAYLAHKREQGHAPNTLRKERQMAIAFFSWAYDEHHVGADTFLSVRRIPFPEGVTARLCPEPYTPRELRQFREVIGTRWPTIENDAQAWKLLGRWREGCTPYARIRKHAIRLQLDAVMALALDCGLRRREILALSVDDMHHDNDYLLVWSGRRWHSPSREIPFTDATRTAVEAWLEFRSSLAPGHDRPWLNLWAEKTAREPIKPDAFGKLLAIYVSPELSYRRLRHTCGIAWLKAGMTLWELQRLLGHALLKDTLPYGEAMQVDLDRRVERLQASFQGSAGVAA